MIRILKTPQPTEWQTQHLPSHPECGKWRGGLVVYPQRCM